MRTIRSSPEGLLSWCEQSAHDDTEDPEQVAEDAVRAAEAAVDGLFAEARGKSES